METTTAWPWNVNVVPGETREARPPVPLGGRVLLRLADRCERRFGPDVPPRTDAAGDYRPLYGIRGTEQSFTYQEIYWRGFAIGYAKQQVKRQASWLRLRLVERGTRLYGRPDPATSDRLIGIDDPRRLRSLCLGLRRSTSWTWLLGR